MTEKRYLLCALSGFECFVKQALLDRIADGLEDRFAYFSPEVASYAADKNGKRRNFSRCAEWK